MKEPALSRKQYTFAWLGLLGLTLLNTLIAFVNLGVWNTVIEIGIATIMASLVAGFLMHALYETKVVRIVVAGGGINDDAISQISRKTNIREFHVGRAARSQFQVDGSVQATLVKALVNSMGQQL